MSSYSSCTTCYSLAAKENINSHPYGISTCHRGQKDFELWHQNFGSSLPAELLSPGTFSSGTLCLCLSPPPSSQTQLHLSHTSCTSLSTGQQIPSISPVQEVIVYFTVLQIVILIAVIGYRNRFLYYMRTKEWDSCRFWGGYWQLTLMTGRAYSNEWVCSPQSHTSPWLQPECQDTGIWVFRINLPYLILLIALKNGLWAC